MFGVGFGAAGRAGDRVRALEWASEFEGEFEFSRQKIQLARAPKLNDGIW